MDNKALLIETIRIQNGRVRHIKYHNQRCNESRKQLFGSEDDIDLRKHINTSNLTHPEVKCRITYDDRVRKVEYQPYQFRPIQSLKFVDIGAFTYDYKYANRDQLTDFFEQREDKDDILMIKNGLITDTYYANVALLKDNIWYTPKHPLLYGSTRARLIENGKLSPLDIYANEWEGFDAICIFNAMISFKKLVLKIKR